MNLKSLLPGFVIVLVLLFTSCGTDEENLMLNFKLKYDNSPLIMFDEYTYPTGETFNITRFSFYISEVNLLSGGESTEVAEVEYIDLTMANIDSESSENGYNYVLRDTEGSSASEISFNIGLTDAMNNTVPADYSSNHPLALSGEYWSSWTSYIYIKIEGNIDLDGDGTLEQGVALHLGSSEVMREVQFSDLNNDGEFSLEINLKKVFENGDIYDIAANPRIHNLNQIDQANILVDNLTQSITNN